MKKFFSNQDNEKAPDSPIISHNENYAKPESTPLANDMPDDPFLHKAATQKARGTDYAGYLEEQERNEKLENWPWKLKEGISYQLHLEPIHTAFLERLYGETWNKWPELVVASLVMAQLNFMMSGELVERLGLNQEDSNGETGHDPK